MKTNTLLIVSLLSIYAFGQVNLDSNLIGYWPFDGNMTDESSNANDGLNFGCTLSDDANGSMDEAFEFNGSTSYIEIPSSYDEITLPFSISAKVFKTELNVYEHIFSSSSSLDDYSGIYLGVNATGNVQVSYGDGSLAGVGSRQTKRTSSSIPINEWVCITVVVNGPNDMIIQINSVDQNGSYSGSGGVLENGMDNAMIGRALHNANYWSGKIDEVRLYNRALTTDELAQICAPKNNVSIIEPIEEAQYTFFPNPSFDFLNLINVNDFKMYSILDFQGRTIQTGAIMNDHIQLNVSELINGNYILKLISNENVVQDIITVSH